MTDTSNDVARVSMDWAKQNSRILTLGTITALGLVLVAYLYVRSGQIRSERAESQYEQAQRLLMSPGDSGLQGETALAAVVERYGGTNAGTLAGLRLAAVKLEKRQFGEAIRALEQTAAKAKAGVFGSAIHGLLGAAYSDSGLHAQAAAEYRTASGFATSEVERQDLQFRAAESLELAGSETEAAALYRELASKAPGDVQGRAKRRLGAILAEPAKPGTSG